jgi:amino acid transporter
MESLGHFIFEFIKITILGFIYSTILYFIYKNIPKNKKPEWCEKWLKSKNTLWLFISLILLFYMFTPYGNHGLGDSARIPISFTKEISNTNWEEFGRLNGIKSSEDNDIELTQFKVENNMIFGNLNSSFYDYKNSYFIYEIDTEKLQEFKTEKEYNEFAINKNLPRTREFKSFKENYSEYWSGWRFFFLP